MKKNNMTCQLCSSKYTYCPTCREFSKLPTWMNMFDKENCKNIYFACSDYFFDKDLEKAKSILNGCDLSGRDDFNPQTRTLLDEILGATIEPKIEVVEEVVVDEPVVEVAVEEIPVEETIEVQTDELDQFVEEVETKDVVRSFKKRRNNK